MKKPSPTALILLATLGLGLAGGIYDYAAGPQRVPAPAPSSSIVASPAPPIRTTNAEALPNIRLQKLDGSSLDLAQMQGKPMLIHFWATWCAPCVTEFPLLIARVQSLQGRLTLVAVSSDTRADTVQRFIARQTPAIQSGIQAANVVMAIDPDRSITNRVFMTTRYPETILVDDAGRMIYKFVGEQDWAAPDIGAILEGAFSSTTMPQK